MKFECPECGEIFDSENCSTSEKEFVRMFENAEKWILHCNCGNKYSAFDNIVYQKPTGGSGEVDPDKVIIPEISLRDYFAGQALSGILSDKAHVQEVLDALKKSDSPKNGFEAITQLTYLYADAMLKERDK